MSPAVTARSPMIIAIPLRLMLCLAMLLAVSAAFSPGHAMSAGQSAQDQCGRWPRGRLIADDGLQARHFVLEAKGAAQLLPPSASPQARKIYHRTFILSLDVAEPISMFRTGGQKPYVIARDKDRTLALKIPVFFVGRAGQSQDDLEHDAERAAFAPSGSLSTGDDFADVRFYLRKSASRFDEIRPFFECGLPGLLLCEGDCPGETAELARSLVNFVLQDPPVEQTQSAGKPAPPRPETAPAPPSAGTPTPAAPPAQPSARAPEPTLPTQRPFPPSPSAGAAPPPPPAAPIPAAPPAQRSAGAPEPALPPLRPPPSPPAGTAPPPPAPPERHAEEPPSNAAPEPRQETAPPPPAAPRLLRRLTLVFERESGAAIAAEDILAAEGGSVRIEGAAFRAMAGGLAAELPEEAFPRVATREVLAPLFPHYEVLTVKTQDGRIVVAAEPLFVSAGDVALKIANAAGVPVLGCDLALDVPADRRVGGGWTNLSISGPRGLTFRAGAERYLPSLPLGVNKNELLISTAKEGGIVRLASPTGLCELEPGPAVTLEELRGLAISRQVRETGPTLIALLSTGAAFSRLLDTASIEDFWSKALGLAGSVSEGPWDRKLLARAQNPGYGLKNSVLEDITRGKLGGGSEAGSVLRALIDGSRSNASSPAIPELRPIERFQLDQALALIRRSAGIVQPAGARQEALLLIKGGIGEGGSYFCRTPLPFAMAPWMRPRWLIFARKIFVIEVWSDDAASGLQRISRAKPAEGAPEGVYSCNIEGGISGKIALYGVVPSALGENTRAAAFAYLTDRANGYLKP